MGLLNPPTSTAKQPGLNTQTQLAVKEFAGIIKSPKHKAPASDNMNFKVGAKSATADRCFSLIGPHQCSVALGGPATSTEDLRYQGA